jgi:hypothetical protein
LAAAEVCERRRRPHARARGCPREDASNVGLKRLCATRDHRHQQLTPSTSCRSRRSLARRKSSATKFDKTWTLPTPNQGAARDGLCRHWRSKYLDDDDRQQLIVLRPDLLVVSLDQTRPNEVYEIPRRPGNQYNGAFDRRQAQTIRALRRVLFGNGGGGKGPSRACHSKRNGRRMAGIDRCCIATAKTMARD